MDRRGGRGREEKMEKWRGKGGREEREGARKVKGEWKAKPDANDVISVRQSTSFSADTDTPIFCCQSMPIPICFKSGRGAA